MGYWCGRWRCGGWWSPGSPGAGTSCLHLLCSIHGCLGWIGYKNIKQWGMLICSEYDPSKLACSLLSATHLHIRHQYISSTGAWFSNDCKDLTAWQGTRTVAPAMVVRAGVKYVLSNTNTYTNTFFSGVSNTNTNTNTPAKIWSNTNTNTNTAHQIQIQIRIHNEAETKLSPFYRWHIEYCIVRRLFIHSNFTENFFQRSNLQ